MKVKEYLTEIGDKEYEVARGPVDKLWYVLGRVEGKGTSKTYYIPVSRGYKSKKEARAFLKKQPLADKEAKGLMPENVVILERKSIVVSTLKHKGSNYELREEVRWGGLVTFVVYQDGHEIGQEPPNMKKEVAIKRFEKNVKSGDYHTRTYKVKGRR